MRQKSVQGVTNGLVRKSDYDSVDPLCVCRCRVCANVGVRVSNQKHDLLRQSMSWKDTYRDKYEQSNLTWDEFVEQRLVHVDEIPETQLDEMNEHLEAVRNEYRDMKREVYELKTMLESEEYDP